MKIETLQATLKSRGVYTTIHGDEFDGTYLVVDDKNVQVVPDGGLILVYTEDDKRHEFNIADIDGIVAVLPQTVRQRDHWITVRWTQKGHSVFDPGGTREFRMTAVWAKAGSVEDAVKELHRAEAYCKKQENWTEWEVSRI